jgi:hypothetical protein
MAAHSMGNLSSNPKAIADHAFPTPQRAAFAEVVFFKVETE